MEKRTTSSTLAVLATATLAVFATCLGFTACERTDLPGSVDKLSADACAQATPLAKHAIVKERRLIAAPSNLRPPQALLTDCYLRVIARATPIHASPIIFFTPRLPANALAPEGKHPT